MERINANPPISRAEIAREAKQLSGDLKELVKSKDLSSRDVDFARNNLRRKYESIIFPSAGTKTSSSSSSTRSLDTINLLWTDTSHQFIHRYRQRIAQLDKSQSKASPNKRNNAGGAGRRKLVHALRSFLAAESAYWVDLLVRMITLHGVTEAAPAIRALGLSTTSGAERAVAPTHTTTEAAAQKAASAQALLMCHRALIYCGDLARYQELYAESEAKGSGGQRRAATEERRLRNYAKAAECYHQARLLVPDNGNPSNQLAVLASYAGDSLSSAYHYYRALCVKQEFPTARHNLGLTFNKALAKPSDNGKPQYGSEKPMDTASLSSTAMLGEVFQKEFVALHGMLFLHRSIEEIDTQLEKTLGLFASTLSRRLLPSELIVKVVCTCFAASWDNRMFGGAQHHNSRSKPASGSEAAATTAEQQAYEALLLRIVIGFLSVLMTESINATTSLPNDESLPDDLSNEVLASRIAPVLRRALPALRIASKWLLSHTNRLANASSLWVKYAPFASTLASRFPVASLPALPVDCALEENVDLVGFMPLHAMTARTLNLGEGGLAANHPNEEHLMRIADLLTDAALLAANSATPLSQAAEKYDVFIVKQDLNPAAQSFPIPDRFASSPKVSAMRLLGEITGVYMEEEDELDYLEREKLGRPEPEDLPEDDVVELAFAASLTDQEQVEDEDEEEKMLYRPQAMQSGAISRSDSATQLNGSKPTADDLLAQLFNGAPNINATNTSTSRSPAFNPSATTAFSGPSIWAPVSSNLPPPGSAAGLAWNNATPSSFGPPGAPRDPNRSSFHRMPGT